jgi:UDP-N-acetylmuramoyl-L-alanyl-D-glutamate--2,6-diaminopimelate ligase
VKLADLIAGLKIRRIEGDEDVEISGVSYDSRKAGPGHLFFAMARDPQRNRANIEDALNRGARAVVVRSGGGGTARPAVSLVTCGEPRRVMAAVAARFFGHPSDSVDLIGITGTSGKTTTSYLLASIFEAAGFPAGVIGTIGIFIRDRKIYSGLTTPESLDFERALSEMLNEGVRRAAAEVSSIGIAEGRVDELNFRACIFTNLGRDHLDYHATEEDYFAAKLRLFTEILPRSSHRDAFAVVRADDPFGRRVLDAFGGAKVSFGLDRAFDVYPQELRADLNGLRGKIIALGKELEFTSPLVGEFQIYNILAASALSVALGIEPAAVAEGVRRCPGAPGRMEPIAVRSGVTVLVDYAHKPDALEAVLRAARRLTPGRIICVFGCGGDRDRGKRPIMGAIAALLSDVPIVTSDNPRTEEPDSIVVEIEAGMAAEGLTRLDAPPAGGRRGYVVEPDRRAAIELALRTAEAGDTVVVAGKGHEDYQLVGSRVLSFDDRAVVREIAAKFGDGQI